MNINGSALEAIRTRSGVSQAELSRITGVSQGTISLIEAGKRGARPDTIKSLAQGLKVPLTAIIREPVDA